MELQEIPFELNRLYNLDSEKEINGSRINILNWLLLIRRMG